MKCFKGVKAYIEGKGVVDADICFNERIISTDKADGEQIILPQNSIVVPGFIDVHIHGAGGSDTMDGSKEALETISKTVAQEGTVGFLATTVGKNTKAIKEYIATQLKQDKEMSQMSIDDLDDPLTGRK